MAARGFLACKPEFMEESSPCLDRYDASLAFAIGSFTVITARPIFTMVQAASQLEPPAGARTPSP
jgi:hypothetical protein